MLKLLLFVSSLSTVILLSESARILAVFPTPSIGHQVVFRSLTHELARRGHDVVVLTTDPAFPKGEPLANLTEIDLHDVSYTLWSKITSLTSRGTRHDFYDQMKFCLRLFGDIFEAQIQTDEVQELIRDKNAKFDLLILEALITPSLAFSHIFKAPVIQISSLTSVRGDFETIGAATHPILYPEITHQRLYSLTIWEKLSEIIKWFFVKLHFYDIEVRDNEMLKRNFGPNMPEINELKNNIDMLFVNVRPVWEDNRPVPPGVVFIGGFYKNKEKELPKGLKSYLDESKSGVIYVSLGTNVNTSLLPPEKVQTMVKVFSKLPYNVLLKWNTADLNTSSNNIKTSKWFPQSDLLRHPNVKLFITQGGLQSTDEAITAGVPLIGIPKIGDEWFNTEKYVKHHIGLKLDMDLLTEKVFEDAITTVINDDSYHHNIIRLRTLMNDEPLPPLERAVWWVEHVLRHGGARHLRAPAHNISWIQYYEMELIIVIIFLILSVAVAVFACIYFAWMFWEWSNEKQKQS